MNNFQFGDQAGIYRSCSVIYEGKMMIFGGIGDYARQISVINQNQNCGLERIQNAEMVQDFQYGGCNVIKEGEKQIVILCFALAHKRSCYR